MLTRIQKTYREFPLPFRVLVGAAFIDRIGGTMLSMLMMALGTAFYMVGFTMYGFVSTYALFIAAILLITVGEMIVMPVGQALAARFAPKDMRGRYMAFFGFSWALPGMVSAWAAGMIMDNYNPNWVWLSVRYHQRHSRGGLLRPLPGDARPL